MATFELKIIPALAVPTEGIVPHAIYLVKQSGAEFAQMYKANAEGTAVTLFSDRVDVRKNLIHRGPTAPAQGTGFPLWYDDEGLALYINMFGETDTWVEAFSAPVMPAFAGTGTAETMARSDHYHVGTSVDSPAW